MTVQNDGENLVNSTSYYNDGGQYSSTILICVHKIFRVDLKVMRKQIFKILMLS